LSGLRAGTLFAGMLLLAGCAPWDAIGTEPPLSPIPGLSEIEVVGTIVSETSSDPITEFTLADGRVISVDTTTVRWVAPIGGSPALLVLGRDDIGDWIAVPGHQDGTPDGCHVLNHPGYELGDSIAVGGVRWLKAPGFLVPGGTPPLGQPYPGGTRYCLDERAQVAEILRP
jgi:hypothetical protein